MPGRDQSGPQGIGPTGRQMGGCAGEPGTAMPFGFGRRIGRRGNRMGRGFDNAGWGFGAAPAPDLQSQKSFLERQLDQINRLLNKDDSNS
ncbi:MAG: DUF5320 domain-containing protein [Anaerolineaceae bacterium]|nr:DUF5320 domain-containing protein [Anaerolineaceae bacterium]